MDIFTTGAGVQFLLRWIHFLSGVAWIGLLFYFNLVQVPFFAETDAPTKSNAIQKLVPRALWWFRWSAMATFVSGAAIIGHRLGTGSWNATYGATILTGAAFGTLMFLNVWLVIWPKQKIVIASTTAVAGGGQADPRAGGAGRRAFLASRTNFVFSFPMLFFMGAGTHFPIAVGAGTVTYAAAAGALMLLLEANALMGDKGPAKQPLETVAGAIHSGIVLAAVVYVLALVLL